MSADFEKFAAAIVARNDDNLLDSGPEEQIANAVKALERFAATTPLRPAVAGHMIDLAGFGAAPVHFYGPEDNYLLLSEVSEALGMPIWEASEWVGQEHLWALESQRRIDEERGDGRLGWQCLRGYCDLRFSFTVHHADDYPHCKPDANGAKWTFYGDWLISHDRLLAFIGASPWSKELMDNMSDLFAHAAKRFFTGDLANLPAIRMEDGVATGATAADMFHTDLTEEEARAKARRGPNGVLGGEA